MTDKAEKPTISDLYNIGDFIDAKDNQGDWRVGFIVQKNDIIKTFKVRFDGWPAKYDQVYRFGSPKLQQFRSQVLGYTGQKQYPALRQGWKYSQVEHEDKMRELYSFDFSKKESKIESARHFNQWIRGHNYFYVDYLMTLTYQNLEQTKKVIDFFKVNLSICINYLKYIAENFSTVMQHFDLNNNEHLEDISVAKSFAFYEIFDTIFTIMGLYPRQITFFKENDEILRQFLSITGKDLKINYQIKMVDFFLKNGGFQAIDNLINIIKKHKRSIRFMFLNSFAHLYNGLSCVIQAKTKELFVQNIKSITLRNIEFLGDKQMKDFNHHQAIQLIGQIVDISRKTSIEADVQNWSKFIEMEIFFKMITCSFFEKKLRGITSFHEFIDRKVQLYKERQVQDLIEDGTLALWIEKKKFFDILFSNDNPELIKKSTELIKYLYQRDNKMQKYIEMIWKYREGKHQTALKEIYNFIGEIPTYDRNQEFTVKLFKKNISQVDQNQWDSEYVKMIKDYTVSALYIITGQNVKETFGFDILYRYAQKNPSDQILLGYFIEICRRLAGTSFMEKFIIQCFKYVQKDINASFHISLLVRLLRQKMVEPRSIDLDGTSIIIEHIVRSKNNDKENLDEKFELLATYLRKAEQVITVEPFIQFWDQMIDSKGRSSFFKWIYKSRNSGQIYIPNFISQETKCFLIEHFWSDEYLIKHPIDESEAILMFEVFKLVNKAQQKLIRDGVIIEVINDSLTGLEKLHSAYRLTKDLKACEVLAKALAQIYTSGSTVLEEDLEIDLVKIFTQRIFKETHMYSKKNDIEGIKKMIRLVEEIINRDEEIYDMQQNIRIEQMKTFQVKHIQRNDERLFRFNMVSNIYSFKKFLAEKFQIPIHKFDMIINDDEVIRYKNYFKSIGQAEIKGKILLRNKQNDNSPTKNKLNLHLELLFELMDNKQIQERVWHIVSRLPISNQIRSKLIQSENQLKILSNTSFYRELYMFKAGLSFQKKWWNVQAQELVGFFLTRLQKTPTSTEIERQYLMVTIKLMQKVFQLDEVANPKFFSETFLAIFQVLKRILIQLNQIESLNTSFVKKFVESFFMIGELFNKYLDKKGLKQTETDSLSLMLKDKNIQGLLKLCLIEYRHELIRKQFPIRLVKLASNVNKERYANRLAGIILNDLLDCTMTTENKNFKEFNLLFNYFLESMSEQLKKFYAEHKGLFFNKLCKLIQIQAPQQNSDTSSSALHSYLSLIRFVIQEVPESDLQKFFAYIYKECLFKGNLSKCKSKETRTSIFNYFLKLIKYRKNLSMFFAQFGLLHVNGLWRSRKLEDWTITHSDRLKSSTGYTGLRNLGCICYMNSFFQQIFMIEEFRRALLLSEDPSYDPKTVDENVLYQVKKMFMNLMFSDRKAYNPKSFCMAFKDYEGNPTNVNEQMDIDEFSGILLDRLQNSLKGTKYPNLIKDTFGGIFSNQIICKGCPHFSESQQSFLSLALTVKDKKSIYESLETMIKGDTLDGENAYYCERCAKKVSAVKRVCLKSLPNYLTIALKRFQFDFNTMQKLKVNDYCEFPHELNLQEYSYEYLRKKQNPKFEFEQLRSKKYYEYKLKGVVIHIGYADSGHYYSLIQERSGQERWLEFNDTVVRKFNVENLHDQAFGGQTGGLDSKEKIKNAYLLIYERVQKINSIKAEVINLGNSFVNMEMYSEVVSTIQKENFQYNIESVLFSNEYVRFISSMIEQAGKQLTNFNLQKFIILAFLTTTMRSKTDPSSFEIIQKIWNSFGKGNQKINSWIIQQFCDPRIYDELFRNCPIKEIKRNLVSWTILMLKDLPSIELKIRFFKTIMLKITIQNENNAQGITILHSFVDEPDCLRFFIQNNIVGRIHENIIRRDPRLFGGIENLVPGPKDAPSEFGYELIIEKTAFELKKNKYDNEQGIVWALLYKIISKFEKVDLPNHLHPAQIEYLALPKQTIYRILKQLKSKFDIDVFTNYLEYLSQGDSQYNEMLIELVEKGIKEFQSKKYRQIFELFKKLIPAEDGLYNERLPWIFSIIRGLKENQKYAMDCTIIELWLCKVVSQNPKLANYLMAQTNITQYLASLPLKKIPSDELSKKNSIFNDPIINKYHGIPFPTSRRGYTKLLKHVEDFYEKLLKGVYEPLHFFQSGNHIVYDKLGVGDKLAFFDQKDKVDYEEAIIKETFHDKLLIAKKSLPNRPIWVWNDDEKLTSNLNVIKDQNSHELDSSKTTEMEDQIDFEAVS